MADVDVATLINSGLHPAATPIEKQPYMVSIDIDLAVAAAAKGSALAAADVLQCIDVPAHTAVLAAGVQKVTAPTGTVSVATLDVGMGDNPDGFVDGWDYFAAAVGDDSTPAAAGQWFNHTAADTVDVVIATLTGTLTGGTLRVWALLLDNSKVNQPGLVQLKS